MTHFRALDEVDAIKTAHRGGKIMITDQVKDMQDDAAIKSSANIIVTNQLRVACNGGGGALGHPNIFLTFGSDGKVTCPYCSREFVKSAD